MQKAKEEIEKLKKEVCKHEIKPEFIPTEATIKQLFAVQQVAT